MQRVHPLRRDLLIDLTDLKPDNVMVRLEDKSILERDARNENEKPLPQKKYDDRTIYLSRNNYGQPTSVTGIVSITDFGLSVHGDVSNNGCIQAEVYRAPEVILEAGWTYSADIWNLGVMVSLVNLSVLGELFEKSDVCHSCGIYWKTSPFSNRSILWNSTTTIKRILRISPHCWGPRHKICLRGEKGLQCFMILRVSPGSSDTGLNSVVIVTFVHKPNRQAKGPRPHFAEFQPRKFYQQNRRRRQEDVPEFCEEDAHMATRRPKYGEGSTSRSLASGRISQWRINNPRLSC